MLELLGVDWTAEVDPQPRCESIKVGGGGTWLHGIHVSNNLENCKLIMYQVNDVVRTSSCVSLSTKVNVLSSQIVDTMPCVSEWQYLTWSPGEYTWASVRRDMRSGVVSSMVCSTTVAMPSLTSMGWPTRPCCSLSMTLTQSPTLIMSCANQNTTVL